MITQIPHWEFGICQCYVVLYHTTANRTLPSQCVVRFILIWKHKQKFLHDLLQLVLELWSKTEISGHLFEVFEFWKIIFVIIFIFCQCYMNQNNVSKKTHFLLTFDNQLINNTGTAISKFNFNSHNAPNMTNNLYDRNIYLIYYD